MAHDHESDDSLLAATATDPEAFGEFYRRHSRSVLKYLTSRTHDVERALDLTAEVFAAALLAAPRYKPGPAPARAWLFGIANHKLSDSRRRQTAETQARRKLGMERLEFDDLELERAEHLMELGRSTLDLETLVADLPQAQRDAVIARVVGERDYEEIAVEQAVSVQAVRQRVSRGLAKLGALARRNGHE